MTRRNAVKRLLVGVPYAVLYVAVLFPLALTVGVVLGAIALLYNLAFGRLPGSLVGAGDRIWSWAGGNMRWALFGRGSFDWLP